jgi:hypothetical protein
MPYRYGKRDLLPIDGRPATSYLSALLPGLALSRDSC